MSLTVNTIPYHRTMVAPVSTSTTFETWKFLFRSTKRVPTGNRSGELTKPAAPKFVTAQGKNYTQALDNAKRKGLFSDKHLVGAYPVATEFLPRAINPREKSLLAKVADGNLVWRDPDPIPGNDYHITYLRFNDNCETAFIKYGIGSEAEVYLSELEIVK